MAGASQARCPLDGWGRRLAGASAISAKVVALSLGFVLTWNRGRELDPEFIAVSFIVALAGVSLTMLLAALVLLLLGLTVRGPR